VALVSHKSWDIHKTRVCVTILDDAQIIPNPICFGKRLSFVSLSTCSMQQVICI
jgi:hypothetical protein